MKLPSTSVLVALIGLSLCVILCVDATLRDDDKALKDGGESGNKFQKRAADDPNGDDTTPTPKKKNSKKNKNKVTDAPSTTTTTSAPTTTAGPTTTTNGPNIKTTTKKSSATSTTTAAPEDSTTKAPDEDSDEYFMQKLVKDQSAERVIISRIDQALKDWMGWLEAHDRKTLNKMKSERILRTVAKIDSRYLSKIEQIDRRDRHLFLRRYQYQNGKLLRFGSRTPRTKPNGQPIVPVTL